MEKVNGNKMVEILDWTYEKSLNGLPGSLSAQELGDNYLKKNINEEKAIKSLVKWQLSKTGTSGFLSGLGGFLTLPVTLPLNITSVIYVQMRMIATIAYIRGYDLKDDEFKTMVYMCLTGQSIADAAKSFGINLAVTAGKAQVKKIPGSVLVKINQKVGFRLVTKFGEKGMINLGKAVPAIGGFIGATFDIATTKTIAKIADKNFKSFKNEDERARVIIN